MILFYDFNYKLQSLDVDGEVEGPGSTTAELCDLE